MVAFVGYQDYRPSMCVSGPWAVGLPTTTFACRCPCCLCLRYCKFLLLHALVDLLPVWEGVLFEHCWPVDGL